MKVTSKTRLNMVIGHPLVHSQSPVLHDAVYQLLGINAVLLAQPNLKLKSIIQVIKTLSIELTAVTLPYKEKVVNYIDQCSVEVQALQTANTLIYRHGKIYGYNTDIDGIAFALRDVSLRRKQVLVIGAGGAARAISYFLKKNKATLLFLNRTHKKAAALAKEFSGTSIRQNELHKTDIDIIINTTPIGLHPMVNDSPLPDYVFRSHQVVFDAIYHPATTQLLKQAKKYGAKTISGIDMFIGQGLKQIELLTGKPIKSTSIITKLRKLLIQNQRVARS